MSDNTETVTIFKIPVSYLRTFETGANVAWPQGVSRMAVNDARRVGHISFTDIYGFAQLTDAGRTALAQVEAH